MSSLLLCLFLLSYCGPQLTAASQKYSVEPIGSGFFKEQQRLGQQVADKLESREFVITSLAKNPRVRLDSGPFSATHYVQANLHSQLAAINLTHVNFQPSVHYISSHLEPPEGPRSHTALHLLAHIDPTPEPAALNRNARVCFEVHVRAKADGRTEVGYCSIPVGQHECVVTVTLKAALAHQYTGSPSRVEATYNAYLSLQGANTRCYMSDHSAIRLHEEARSVPGSLPVVAARQIEREIDNDLRVVYREHRLKPGNDLQVDILVKEFSKIVTFSLEVQIEPPGVAAAFDHVLLNQRQNWVTRWSIADGNRSLSINGTISNEYFNAKLSTKSLICTVFVRALSRESSDRVRLRWFVKKTSERGGNWVNRRADEQAAIVTEHRLYDGVRGLVAVYKEADLLNLAAISGELAHSQLWLYAVNDAFVPERIRTANCYHSKEDVIKVGKRCEYVYFNGTERSGGDGAIITAKWRSHTVEFAFNVYYPVFPLRVTLTDSELQRIRGWRVPRLPLGASGAGGGYSYLRPAPPPPQRRRLSRRASRRRYGSGGGGAGGVYCRKKFQDARVQVFTRFVMRSQKNGGALLSIPKFSSGGAALSASSASSMPADGPAEQHQLLDVTHFAVGRLAVSDPSVAALKGSTLEGVGRGRALVSVAEPRYGNASLSVGTGGSVRIKSVDAYFVTNLSVLLIGDQLMGRYLTAHIGRHFDRFNQSGYVRLVIQFSDGTSAAVEDIDPDYITVQVVNYDAAVVRPLDRSLRTNWPIFYAIAEAEERTLVTVRLLQSDFCGGGSGRGSGRPLLRPPASSLIEVRGRVKFPNRRESPAAPASGSGPTSTSGSPQSPPTLRSGAVGGDASSSGGGSGQGGRRAPSVNLDSFLPSPSDYQLFPGDASASGSSGSSSSSSGSTGYRSSRNGFGGQQPPASSKEVQQGSGSGGGGGSFSSASAAGGGKMPAPARRSPFQIGMFVLLAIFCLAVMVFFVNFAVMCARYRKHRRLPSADSSEAAHRQAAADQQQQQQQQLQHLLHQHQSPLPLHAGGALQSPALLSQSGGDRRSPGSSIGPAGLKQRGQLQPGEEEYTDNNWVWVGLDTLQDKKLSRDDGTIYRHTKFIQPVRSAAPAASAAPASSAASTGAPQSPTDSASHLTTFGRHGGPLTATVASPAASLAAAAAAGTTYQGQECSIRIVANPLESLQPTRLTPRLGTSSMLGSRQHSLAIDGSLPRPPMRTSSRRLSPGAPPPLASASMSASPVPLPAVAAPSPLPALNPCATPRFSRQLPPPYSAASSSSSTAGARSGDLSWSQSMRRMDYGQLLAYFDHMKETAA